MNTERDNWKDVTPEDATDSELRLVHRIHGPKPEWMDAANWRNNMRACAKDIREHVALMANAEVSEVAVADSTKTSGVRPPLSLD